jgi:hypothetical protein
MKSYAPKSTQQLLALTFLLAAVCLLPISPASAQQQQLGIKPVLSPAVQANLPYTVSVFAQSVVGVYTQPDSIAYDRDSIFIGYGDHVAPDGSDGKSSTVVQYSYNGEVKQILSVKGHNDGLKIDPYTGDLWAIQNEDANARLVIFNTKNWTRKEYTLGTGPHGGGYDDVVFRNHETYLSASNPSNNPNNEPAIVQITIKGNKFALTPVLLGNSTAVDIPTGNPVMLNLQDPDSMTLNPGGDIVLDSQADGELVVVRNPGSLSQEVFRVLLTVDSMPTTVDDTSSVNNSSGALLVSDRDGETVYAITAPFFQPGSGYSASDSGGFVGELRFDTGELFPAVTGMVSPHGMMFIPLP